jgi:SHS2 domain-containing protein
LDDAVAALRELCVGPGATVAPRSTRAIAATGSDPADLLLRFAREVLAAFALEALVPACFELDDLHLPPAPPALSGHLLGEPFDPSRHATQPEIKAVTRHGLQVGQHAQGWHAELLFDI